MGSRVILCGSVHMSLQSFQALQNRPMIDLFVAEGDADDGNFVPRGFCAKELFSTDVEELRAVTRNVFDPKAERWLFACSFHDDDWFNANTQGLPELLVTSKDRDGLDVVFAFTGWSGELDAAWVFSPGKVSSPEVLPPIPKPVATLILDGNLEKAVPLVAALFRPE